MSSLSFRRVFPALLGVLLAFAPMAARSQNYVEVGTGIVETTMPVYTSWNYSWSSLIYPQSELGSAKTFIKIAMNCGRNPKSVTNQKIYMKLTTDAVFAAANYENPTANGYTLVYDGNITFVNGWTEITLQTPFAYDGTKNLVIHWENRWGVSDYGPYLLSTSSTVNNTKNCGSDLSFPTSSGYLNPYPNSLTNMRFYYNSTGPATPTNPIPADEATRVDIGTNLQWTLGANTTSYDLYFGLNPAALTMVVNNAPCTAGTYTYDPTGLLLGDTMYYWKVVAKNGTQTEPSPVWNFTTQTVITTFPYTQGFEDSTVFNTYPEVSAWDIIPELSWYENNTTPHSGDLCAKAFSLSSSSQAVLKTPRMILPSGHRIKFFWRNGEDKVANHDTTYFEATTNGGATWTTVGFYSPASSGNYLEATYDLSAYAGDNTYLRWRYRTDGTSSAESIYLDDILIEQVTSGPAIQITPATLNFRELYVGGHTHAKVAVKNTGTTNLVITGVAVAAPYSTAYAATLAPNQTDSVTFTFTPSAAGSNNATATFTIQGAYSGTNTLAISGASLSCNDELFEAFDASNQVPLHWNQLHSATDPNNKVTIVTSSFDSHSVPNVAKMANATDTISPLMFITPGLAAFDQNQFTFFAKKGGNYLAEVEVGLMDDPYDAESYTAVQTFQLTETHTQYTVNFAAGNTKPYVVFRHKNLKSFTSLWIDDVVWENPVQNDPPNPATCSYPADYASPVDLFLPANYLIWANGGGAPDGYLVYFGTNNPPTNLLNGVDAGDTTVYQLAQNLSFGTTYYWQIVPYNAYGSAANCPVWRFTTMSDPTISSFGYSENFDAVVPGSAFYYPPLLNGNEYPIGWRVLSPDNNSMQWTVIANTSGSPNNAHSAPNAMHIGWSYTLPMNDFLVTPPMQLSTDYNYTISFYYKTATIGIPSVEKMNLVVGTQPTVAGLVQQLWSNDAITNLDYEPASAVFHPETDGIYYFGFHSYSDALQFLLYVDDVTIDAAPVGIIENSGERFTVSPNPSNGSFVVTTNQPMEPGATLEVIDMTGRRVLALPMTNPTLVVNLPENLHGVMVVRLINGQTATTSRVVVK